MRDVDNQISRFEEAKRGMHAADLSVPWSGGHTVGALLHSAQQQVSVPVAALKTTHCRGGATSTGQKQQI